MNNNSEQPAKTGIELIAEERKEQIEKHNRSIEKDIELNGDYQLLNGASLLLHKWPEGRPPKKGKHPNEAEDDSLDDVFRMLVPAGWDKNIWYKMFDKPYKERLIIAGALIAAEIDRINSKPIKEE